MNIRILSTYLAALALAPHLSAMDKFPTDQDQGGKKSSTNNKIPLLEEDQITAAFINKSKKRFEQLEQQMSSLQDRMNSLSGKLRRFSNQMMIGQAQLENDFNVQLSSLQNHYAEELRRQQSLIEKTYSSMILLQPRLNDALQQIQYLTASVQEQQNYINLQTERIASLEWQVRSLTNQNNSGLEESDQNQLESIEEEENPELVQGNPLVLNATDQNRSELIEEEEYDLEPEQDLDLGAPNQIQPE